MKIKYNIHQYLSIKSQAVKNPPETIFAEKLETVISKGATNSRMKDYHDLLLLKREPLVLDIKKLQTAIKKTFYHRGTVFELIDFSAKDLQQLDRLWNAHLKNLEGIAKILNLPDNIQEVIQEINTLLIEFTLEYSHD